MANIFNEIDEDIRKEKYKSLWKKYGKYLIGLILSIVIIFSINQFRISNSVSNNEKLLEMYFHASEKEENGQFLIAEDFFNQIYKGENETLSAFSKLKLSNLYLSNSEIDKANFELKELYNNTLMENIYRELALYKYILINIDEISIEEIQNTIDSLSIKIMTLEPYFQEIVALKYLIINKNKSANIIFNKLLNDNSTPVDLMTRLEKLILISEK